MDDTRLRAGDRGRDAAVDACAAAVRASELARDCLPAGHVGRLGDQHRGRRVVLAANADAAGDLYSFLIVNVTVRVEQSSAIPVRWRTSMVLAFVSSCARPDRFAGHPEPPGSGEVI